MSANIDTLLRQAEQGNIRSAITAARHPKVTVEQLMALAHYAMDEVRLAVAENPATTGPILSILVYDTSAEVVCAVAKHPKLPATCFEQLLVRVLADLIGCKGRQRAAIISIGVALASNPDTPAAVMERMFSQVTDSQFFRVMAAQATRPDVLERFVGHPKATIRQMVTENPAASDEMLEFLLRDGNAKVAECAALALENRGGSGDLEVHQAELMRDRYAALVDTCDADRATLLGGATAEAAIAAFCGERLADGMTVIDAACDTGAWLARFAQKNPSGRFIGLELVPEMIARAKGIVPVGTTLIEANIGAELPLENRSADVMLTIDCLHCLLDVTGFFEETRRVLKNNGQWLGVVRCMADDSVDNVLYAEAAERHGLYIPVRSDAEQMIGTSGLVIERLDCGVAAIPAIADAKALSALGDVTWAEILTEAVEDGAMASSIRMSLLFVAGRNMAL